MENNTLDLWLKLLSAGVISAFVTGLFSLIVVIKNNKKLVEIEKSKQKFSLNQERYKVLREAYNELLKILPEEKSLGHIIMNLPITEGFLENGLIKAYELAEDNMKILYAHYKRNCYLFNENEQKRIEQSIEDIDNITKNIIEKSIGLKIYNDSIGDRESSNDIYNIIMARILKVTEFEELYYSLYKSKLNEMTYIDS